MSVDWTIEKAAETFAARGLRLLEADFRGVDVPMRCIALCGCEKRLTLSNLRIGHGLYCKDCGYKNGSLKRKHNYSYIKSYFEMQQCRLISVKYHGSHEKLRYVARCGHENVVNFHKFKNGGQGRVCKTCAQRGKGKAFEADISDFPTLGEPDFHTFSTWRLNVLERDNYVCIICNKQEENVSTHHMSGYNWDELNRFNIHNGVTLCIKCHNNYHKNYGYGMNSIIQFEQWYMGIPR
jgi:hypothetical protein